jgi:hypothetical protein
MHLHVCCALQPARMLLLETATYPACHQQMSLSPLAHVHTLTHTPLTHPAVADQVL